MVRSITNSIDMNLTKFQEIMKDREACCAAVHGSKESAGHDLATEQQLLRKLNSQSHQALKAGSHLPPSMKTLCCCCYVTSVVSVSVQPHRQQPTRLLCPWDSPGKKSGVGCHFLLHENTLPTAYLCMRSYHTVLKAFIFMILEGRDAA